MFKIIISIFILLSLNLSSQAEESADNDLTIMTENYPPYNMLENDSLTGISVDLLEAMFQQMKMLLLVNTCLVFQ